MSAANLTKTVLCAEKCYHQGCYLSALMWRKAPRGLLVLLSKASLCACSCVCVCVDTFVMSPGCSHCSHNFNQFRMRTTSHQTVRKALIQVNAWLFDWWNTHSTGYCFCRLEFMCPLNDRWWPFAGNRTWNQTFSHEYLNSNPVSQ